MSAPTRVKVSPGSKGTSRTQQMDEDAMLSTAIERRKSDLVDPYRPGGQLHSPSSSTASLHGISPTLRPAPPRGMQQRQQPDSRRPPHTAAHKAPGGAPNGGVHEAGSAPPMGGQVCGVGLAQLEARIMGLFSLTDVALHGFSAWQLHVTYSVETAEPFWGVLILSLIVSLVCVVSFVSKVCACMRACVRACVPFLCSCVPKLTAGLTAGRVAHAPCSLCRRIALRMATAPFCSR